MARDKRLDNLIPDSKRSPEELRRIKQAGGIASGAARRRKRDMARAIELSWGSRVPISAETRGSLEALGYDFDARGDPTALDMMVAAITARAMEGDLDAAEFLARYGLVPDRRAELERERLRAEQKLEREKLAIEREKLAAGAPDADRPVVLLCRPEDEA